MKNRIWKVKNMNIPWCVITKMEPTSEIVQTIKHSEVFPLSGIKLTRVCIS